MLAQFDPVTTGKAVEGFLNSEVIQQIFRERKLLYFEQWLKSNDPAERERIFAEARAFDSLGSSLQAVVNAGVQATAQEDLERRAD